MKKTLAVFLMITIALLHVSAAESGLRLELDSSVRSIRLGQSTKLKLKIIGSGIYEITEGTEGINANNMKAGAFVYEFVFKPQRKGMFTFGPYSVSVNGQNLKSNKILINVVSQWEGTYGTFFRVDTNSIVLGEDIELVAETWEKKYSHKSMFLDRKESFMMRLGNSSTSTSSFSSNADGMVVYKCRSWYITPKKAGKFTISKDIFKEFPEDINPPEFTIMVAEPARQKAGTDK
jgi:hypothetical protein